MSLETSDDLGEPFDNARRVITAQCLEHALHRCHTYRKLGTHETFVLRVFLKNEKQELDTCTVPSDAE